MAKRRPPPSPPSTDSAPGAEVIHLPWPDVLSPEQIERIILAPLIDELEPPVRGMKPRLVEDPSARQLVAEPKLSSGETE